MADGMDTPVASAPAQRVAITRSTEPWWLVPLMKYGVGSSIGLYLVWWMTHVVTVQLTNIETHLNEHVQSSMALVQELTNSNKEEVRYRHALLELSALNCRQNAKSDQSKELCDAVVNRIDSPIR